MYQKKDYWYNAKTKPEILWVSGKNGWKSIDQKGFRIYVGLKANIKCVEKVKDKTGRSEMTGRGGDEQKIECRIESTNLRLQSMPKPITPNNFRKISGVKFII